MSVERPVCCSVAVTVTPGTTPPLLSVMTPLICPCLSKRGSDERGENRPRKPKTRPHLDPLVTKEPTGTLRANAGDRNCRTYDVLVSSQKSGGLAHKLGRRISETECMYLLLLCPPFTAMTHRLAMARSLIRDTGTAQ